jgi:hypothetical protein
MADDLRALAADFNTKLAAAVAAEKRLVDAQQSAGVSAPKQIFTAGELKEMRTDWYDEWVSMLPKFVTAAIADASGQSSSPFAPRRAAATNATADQIIRAGAKRRGENVVDLNRR